MSSFSKTDSTVSDVHLVQIVQDFAIYRQIWLDLETGMVLAHLSWTDLVNHIYKDFPPALGLRQDFNPGLHLF